MPTSRLRLMYSHLMLYLSVSPLLRVTALINTTIWFGWLCVDTWRASFSSSTHYHALILYSLKSDVQFRDSKQNPTKMTIKDLENRTLATVWVCISLAVLIMGARLLLGRICKKKFDMGDELTAFAIFFAIARIAFVHVIVLWKTNNISPDLGSLDGISRQEIYEKETGSKMTLIARCLYILLWDTCLLLSSCSLSTRLRRQTDSGFKNRFSSLSTKPS